MRTSTHIVCAVALVALASGGPAGAATPGPGAPSVDQYIEAIPTSAGPQSVAGGEERVQPLPRETELQVEAEAGPDAEVLTKIATSSRYGAPIAPRGEEPAEKGDDSVATALEPTPAQAADGAELRLFGLIAFMIASLVAGVAWQRVRGTPGR
jgi:hypothetical protein